MNTLLSFVAIALLLCAAAPLASAEDGRPSVYISIMNDDADSLGIFFVGNETERLYPPAPPDGDIHAVAPNADFEMLTAAIQPGEHVQQGTQFDTAFVVRTGDMMFRAKITVSKGEVARAPRTFAIRCYPPRAVDPGVAMVARGGGRGRTPHVTLSARARARRLSSALLLTLPAKRERSDPTPTAPRDAPRISPMATITHTRCAPCTQNRPYMLSFKNLMSERVQPTSLAPSGGIMMELKHSDSDYVWIDPGASSARFFRHGPGTTRGSSCDLLRRRAGVYAATASIRAG